MFTFWSQTRVSYLIDRSILEVSDKSRFRCGFLALGGGVAFFLIFILTL